MSPSIKFTYFDIEAAGEPVRLALVLSKTPFDDIRVNMPDWPALKATLPAGQVPVMTIDDGPVRTQSKAMIRWVGCTFSETLYPREKLFDIEEAIGYVEDFQRAFYPCQYMGFSPERFGYSADFSTTDNGKKLIQTMREKFIKEELPKYMTRMSEMITAHGGKWLVAGAEPTIADCIAVPLLRQFTRGYCWRIHSAQLRCDLNPNLTGPMPQNKWI